MRLVRVRESDDLGALEALRTHFFTSVLSKMPLGRGRENYVSRGRRLTEISLPTSGRTKMRFGRGRESDVSSGRQALQTMRIFLQRMEKSLCNVRISHL